jgi:hypothetical protein
MEGNLVFTARWGTMKIKENGMIKRYHSTDDPDGQEKKKKNPEKQTESVNDDTCRCKEASDMTPGQLLGLMISDLAFWKKAKKS